MSLVIRSLFSSACILLGCLSCPAQERTPSKRQVQQPAEAQVVRTTKRTALMRASEKGNVARVRALLKSGADVNAQLGSGETALMLAARRGHLKVVKHLLARGADPNIKLYDFHSGDYSVLMTAIGIESAKRLEILDAMIDAGAEVNPSGEFFRSPLIYAIEQRDVLSLKHLLSKGAEVNLKSGPGYTPLMVAVLKRSSAEVLKLLIDAGADVNARSTDGTTALMLAEQQDQEDAVRVLKEAGARR